MKYHALDTTIQSSTAYDATHWIYKERYDCWVLQAYVANFSPYTQVSDPDLPVILIVKVIATVLSYLSQEKLWMTSAGLKVSSGTVFIHMVKSSEVYERVSWHTWLLKAYLAVSMWTVYTGLTNQGPYSEVSAHSVQLMEIVSQFRNVVRHGGAKPLHCEQLIKSL